MFIRNVTEHFSKNPIENLYFDLKSTATEKAWIPTTTLQYSSTTEEVRQKNYWFLLSLLHCVEPDSYYKWMFCGLKKATNQNLKKLATGLSFVLFLVGCYVLMFMLTVSFARSISAENFWLFYTAQSWCTCCIVKSSKEIRKCEKQWKAAGCGRTHRSLGICSQWLGLWYCLLHDVRVQLYTHAKNYSMQWPYLQIITYIVYRSNQEKSKCFSWPQKEPWPWPWSAYLLADRQSGNTQMLLGLCSVQPQTALAEKVNGAASSSCRRSTWQAICSKSISSLPFLQDSVQ